ncbi:MAG TPA: GIY-YIG nuclease family protein [Rhizomicrobium sp.]|nr:GIY-YIG nuclease family protein [Rhizomicrobium sp.]
MGGLDPPIQSQQAGLVPSGFVYILASERNGTLYIGVTSNIPERMEQHRNGAGSQFVKKYGVTKLVWFEEYPLYVDAIRRETAMKRWKRSWKMALIEKTNPTWKDLIEEWHK